ncbi:hypothetical protein NOE29_09000 [Escherichia coli]|nr:hypothetical protein [Escherichia coli]MCQ1632895.1 hypothetical protein [Escherichia coli]
MALNNVTVPAGVWTQVHDGSTEATLALAGYALAQICQSSSVPPDDFTGLPFVAVGAFSHDVYYATKGAPIYVKPSKDAVVIVNHE